MSFPAIFHIIIMSKAEHFLRRPRYLKKAYLTGKEPSFYDTSLERFIIIYFFIFTTKGYLRCSKTRVSFEYECSPGEYSLTSFKHAITFMERALNESLTYF